MTITVKDLRRLQRLATAGLAISLLGCGQSDPPSTAYPRVLGGVKEGAPLALSYAADKGILEDLTTYQPTKAPGSGIVGGSSKSSGAAPAGAATNAADAQAQAAVDGLHDAIIGGNVDAIFKLINQDHVAAMTDAQRSELYPTFEKLQLVQKTVMNKVATMLGGAKGAQAASGIDPKAFVPKPKLELVAPELANVTPNPLIGVLGPTLPPALTLAKQGDTWLFQLEKPLTADDAKQIVEYHKRLQGGVDKMLEWLDQQEDINIPGFLAAVAKLEATGDFTPPEAGAPEEKPADEAPTAPDTPAEEKPEEKKEEGP